MRKYLLVILALIHFGAINSQEPVNLILKYYGFSVDPYKYTFVSSHCTAESGDSIINKIAQYYDQNQEQILFSSDCNNHEMHLKKINAIKTRNEEKMQEFSNEISNGLTQMFANIKKDEAEKKQKKTAEKEQQLERLQAMTAQNKKKYAEFQAMTNKKTNTSSYQSLGNSQNNNYQDLLTSDPEWNKAIQASVQQYGIERTREMVKQKKFNDYKQSRNNSQNQSNNQRVISAVTESRQQIKIKIKGDVITEYSNGLDPAGRQNWIPSVPNSYISKTGAGSIYTSKLSKEFSHTAKIGNIQIYFDL